MRPPLICKKQQRLHLLRKINSKIIFVCICICYEMHNSFEHTFSLSVIPFGRTVNGGDLMGGTVSLCDKRMAHRWHNEYWCYILTQPKKVAWGKAFVSFVWRTCAHAFATQVLHPPPPSIPFPPVEKCMRRGCLGRGGSFFTLQPWTWPQTLPQEHQ